MATHRPKPPGVGARPLPRAEGPKPLFTAYSLDNWLFSADSLDAVLAHLRECDAPDAGDDSVVYWAGRVVAVRDSHGTVTRFGPSLPAGQPVIRLLFQSLAPRRKEPT